MLLQLFQTYYSSIRSAKVVLDLNTGVSKGYGFVRFGDQVEQRNALAQMKGVLCGSRPIRVSIATPKNRLNYPLAVRLNHPPITMQQHPAFPINYDPNNTTVFVGGLGTRVSEEELQK
jgi:RNA recognition motif-containing protein